MMEARPLCKSVVLLLRRWIGWIGQAAVTLTVVPVLLFLIIVVVAVMLWQEPRLSVGVGIAVLLPTAIALMLGQKGLAEVLAISAYLFLVVGVVLLLVRHILEQHRGVKE